MEIPFFITIFLCFIEFFLDFLNFSNFFFEFFLFYFNFSVSYFKVSTPGENHKTSIEILIESKIRFFPLFFSAFLALSSSSSFLVIISLLSPLSSGDLTQKKFILSFQNLFADIKMQREAENFNKVFLEFKVEGLKKGWENCEKVKKKKFCEKKSENKNKSEKKRKKNYWDLWIFFQELKK